MKRWWFFLFTEPFRWLFAYFFQPTAFRRDFEGSFLHRIAWILRFLLPIFVCVYPITLIIRLILPPFFPNLYGYYLTHGGLLRLLTDTAWGTVFGMAGGILGAMAFNLPIGVTLCISIGLMGGAMADTSTVPQGALGAAIEASSIYGILFGLLFGLTITGLQGTRARSTFAVITGGIAGSILGIATGLGAGYLMGVLSGLIPDFTGPDTTFSTGGAIIGAIVGVSAMSTVSSVVRNISRRSPASVLRAIYVGRAIAISFSLLMGVAGGVIGVITSSRGIIEQESQFSEVLILTVGLVSGGLFIICYLIGYFRLPLYPVSAFSTIKAYRASHKNPNRVFSLLQRSSLYWDERVFLPLPLLKQLLLIAAQVDMPCMLKEIDFILAERPQQTLEASQALITIALDNLGQRHTMQEISRASQKLDEIIPPPVRQVNEPWVQALVGLGDASRNAALSLSTISRQARQRALDNMINALDNIRTNVALEDMGREDLQRNKKLRAIIAQWKSSALQEKGRLQAGSSQRSALKNPYVSGAPLLLNAESFVGRQDLAIRLEQTLEEDANRPTICLRGERRMGKTSTLHHLPRMLGGRYIPLFFDLEQYRNSADATAFLSSTAREIFSALQRRGLRIRKLEYTTLREVAIQENVAKTYFVFDEWLDEVEAILKEHDLTILLTFDEFEHLQQAHQAQYLDLAPLLNWFRSVIQNRPRLSLLFSGVHELGEMGPDWASHFVNVQTFQVSFLQPDEATHLILAPTPDYPGEQIYDKETVEEIIRVTGRHPFLVQAICSALIEQLNSERRGQAKKQDVAGAMVHTLEGWPNYFQDLWYRTPQEQQRCLFALQHSDSATSPQVAQQSGLAEQVTRETLDSLVKRDLVLHEQETYRLAAPMYCEWLARYQ